MHLLVYPLIAHCMFHLYLYLFLLIFTSPKGVWSPDGWLYKLGVIDAGGLVHIVGGSAGLIGAILVRPFFKFSLYFYSFVISLPFLSLIHLSSLGQG
jgi:ammonia channel protein AmtB